MSPRIRAVGAASAGLLALAMAPAAAASSSGRPEVVLNHLSVVLDVATAHDVATNAFLKDAFASVSQKSNVSNDGKRWSGTYLYGERTYVEAYEAGPAQGEPGSSGIAFGVERLCEVVRTSHQHPAGAIREAVLSSLRNYTEGQNLLDDVTLLVIKPA